MNEIKTVDVVVKALERLGFDLAFGMPGMWSLPLYNAISTSNIRHILVRHEQHAAYAADGYARASGRVGLCLGTAGPGAVNIASGIAVPFKDHSPVLAITGQVPTYEQGRGWIEDLDLRAIFSPLTKFAAIISDPSEAYDVVCRAYISSVEGCPGPSYVGIPGDIQKKPSKDKGYLPTVSLLPPEPRSIELVAELIRESARPVILAGWGAVLSNASELIIQLAETIGAQVATSMMGRGVIPEDHPLSLGPAGRRGSPSANYALSGCDLLLALGCRLTNLTLGDLRLNCKIIQVDVEESNFSPLATFKVKSDVSLFIETLIPKFRGRSHSPVNKTAVLPETQSGANGIAKEYAHALARLSEATFTVDIGQHTIWLMQALRVKRPRQVIFSGNLSAMGYSLPAAMGVKLANPDRKVVAVMGDGGFQMSSSELSTIEENNLAIGICVFNNQSLGLIRQLQEVAYQKPYGVDYSAPPDYLKLADAYGIEGVLVSDPADLEEVLQTIREPVLIEIPIPRSAGVDLSKPRILEDK
ncbi:MAG: thiamine pyrophosphate-binding protein [Candidatus Methanomethyliales bacterium]|nr:thiamine pyrophosphate-binding protein [Candidatus Methanomethylicales archaeon]